MEYPVKSIEYLLNEWEVLRHEDIYHFYALFLFTEENTNFAEFFNKNFQEINDWSENICKFSAIATLKIDELKNQSPLSGKDSGYQNYDIDSVKKSARYFSVPTETLPTIVIFPTKTYSQQVLSVHIGGLNQEELENFIYNLFRLLRTYVSKNFGRLRRLVDILPYDRKRTDKWFDMLVSLYDQALLQDWSNHFIFIQEDLKAHNIAYRTELPQTVQDTLVSLQSELQQLSNANRLTQQNQALKELTRLWIEEGDEQEQTETWEYLRQALDEDRLSNRPLFP